MEQIEKEQVWVSRSNGLLILNTHTHTRTHAHSITEVSDNLPELPGVCYRKMPKYVLKKEKWFDFTIETSIDFKKGQILNIF